MLRCGFLCINPVWKVLESVACWLWFWKMRVAVSLNIVFFHICFSPFLLFYDSKYISYMCCVFFFSVFSTFFSLYFICIFSNNLFKKKLFLRTVLGLQWNWEGTEIFHILLAPHMDNLLCYQHHSSEWYVLTKDETSQSLKVYSLSYGSLWVLYIGWI